MTWTLKAGSIVKTKEYISVNQYIRSPNGLFVAKLQEDGHFIVSRGIDPEHDAGPAWYTGKYLPTGETGQFYAIMQEDGNFVIYKGTGPDDKGDVWWDTVKFLPAGQTRQFYAAMQDDGNFVVYKGTGPDDNQGVWWDSQSLDPVVDFVELSDIEYDLKAAKTLNSSPQELDTQHVTNPTDADQSPSMSNSKSVQETSGWSDALGAKVGVKTEFECGIPLLAEDKVEVSVEVSNTYTWSGQNSRTRTWSWNFPVHVPPYHVIEASMIVTNSTLSVPYVLTGTAVYKSGARLPKAKLSGTYTGANSHDLTVTYKQLKPPTSMGAKTPKPLKVENATSTVVPNP